MVMTRERSLELANSQLATQYKRVRDDLFEAIGRADAWKSSAIMGWMFFFIAQIAWVIRSLT